MRFRSFDHLLSHQAREIPGLPALIYGRDRQICT